VDEADRRRSARRFARDVVRRFVSADGMTHARALAYESLFIVLSGFIGVVGLASLLDVEELRGVVEQLGRSIAPGPTARLIAEAARQGASGGTSAAFFGLAAALLAGTFAMAQIERSANRLAGSNRDRPAVRRFVVAFLLAATVGVVFVAGALVLGAGRALATGFGVRDTAEVAWSILRWPIGVLVVLLSLILLYRVAPRRRIGSTRAVFAGTAVAVVLWVAFTGLLSLYFSLSSSSAYGPLLAIVALLVWSMLTSVALHLGIATVCELSRAPRPDRAEEPIRIPEAAVPTPSAPVPAARSDEDR
jgi:YihY family inner membrane protein